MINIIAWLLIGAVAGWMVTSFMGASESLVLNLIVGSGGAVGTGLMLTPLFGISAISENNFSLMIMLIAWVGAVILVGMVSFFRWRRDQRLR